MFTMYDSDKGDLDKSHLRIKFMVNFPHIWILFAKLAFMRGSGGTLGKYERSSGQSWQMGGGWVWPLAHQKRLFMEGVDTSGPKSCVSSSGRNYRIVADKLKTGFNPYVCSWCRIAILKNCLVSLLVCNTSTSFLSILHCGGDVHYYPASESWTSRVWLRAA